MTYDQSSYDLGSSFLEDEPHFQRLPADVQEKHRDQLAKDIQTAIEDYLRFQLGPTNDVGDPIERDEDIDNNNGDLSPEDQRLAEGLRP